MKYSLISYISETKEILDKLDLGKLHNILKLVDKSKRLFIIGIGGSAAHASHAVNDFRKMCGKQAFTPTDNVSELTARINDDGWGVSYVDWLNTFKPTPKDLILVLSVGGGNTIEHISMPLVYCMIDAKKKRVPIAAIVGRDGGTAAMVATECLIIPTINEKRITPHVEGITSVLLHLIAAEIKESK